MSSSRFRASLRCVSFGFPLALMASIGAPAARANDYAVIVNEGNPVRSLSKTALIRIFRAEQQFWEDPGGRIQVLLPKSGSKEKELLLREIYRMSDDELKRYWTELVFRNVISEPPRVVPSTAVVLGILARSKGVIAVVDAGELDTKTTARIVAIDGKKPGDAGYLLHDAEKKVGRARTETPEANAFVPDDGADAVQAIPALAEADAQGEQDLSERVKALEQMVGELQADAARGVEEGTGFDLGPRLHLRGFSDVTFEASRTKTDGAGTETKDFFAIGGLDLLFTSQLAERVSFLNETVFEANSENETVADVERLILKYDFGDALNVQAGRFHTTLGYWNTAFHHGQWTQTSIGRPQIIAFEDQNGILPVHTIGMALKGNQDTSVAGFDYTLEVGNGRGPTPDPPQSVSDADDGKSLNLAFGVEPSGAPGFYFGANAMFDTIPPNGDATLGPVHSSMFERILGLFVTYEKAGWGVIAEGYGIHHDEDGAPDADSTGGTVQLSKKLGEWIPYLRFDWTDLDDTDNYFASDDNVNAMIAGVRWDVDTWFAIKLQVAHGEVNGASGAPDQDVDSVVIQTAFVF